MNTPIKNGTLETAVSRRGFVQGAAGLSFAFTFGGALFGKPSEAFAADSAKLNAWVTIGADNKLTILSPTSEMGQGVLTALPLILAEELDADWSKVKCEFAPGNPKLYGGVHKMFPGAQARRVLLDNVAASWKVPVEELSTEPSTVVHKKSKRRISYGDVAKFATVPAELPQIKPEDL